MSAQCWYKHYPTDFVHGVVGLGAAEIGAYIVILDLIYDRGGPVPNDARWIGGILGEHPKRARALIQHLMDAGKLVEKDGELENSRALIEIKSTANRSDIASKSGKKGAFSRWGTKENQTLSDAHLIATSTSTRIDRKNICPISPEKTEKREQQRAVEVAFSEFWKAYPQRVGDNPRKTAFASYQRAIAHGAVPEMILAGTRRLAAKHPTPTAFVPMASTWLNQERWEDGQPGGEPAARVTTIAEDYADDPEFLRANGFT